MAMSKKVSIAEDEDQIRMVIKSAIETDDYEIYEARDGLEALDIAQRVKPDLLILDVMMPGKNGYQVCETLRADQECKNIYILFLTGRSMQKAKETVQECGGDDFMENPFDIKELKEKVIAILGS